MIDNNVLVVDADQETEEKIVATLEKEGYIVFTASGHDISAGMADKINPSLIYLKATSSTIEVCKTIRNIEKLRKIPIILLASLSETLDAQAYFDGIVDYLKMPVSLHELVEKTARILGNTSNFKGDEEDIGLEEPTQIKDEYSFDTQTDKISEIAKPNEEYSYNDIKEERMVGLPKKTIRKRPYRSGLLTPFLVVMAAIVIVTAGFFIYKSFISKPEIPESVAVNPPKTVQHQEPAISVLPPPEEQNQEKPVSEEKPAIRNEVTQVAPEVDAPDTNVAVKPFYSAQLGAFKIETNAAALANAYKEKGYKVFIHGVTTKDNEILYFVLIDKFENREEALHLAEDIRTKENIDTTVFRGKAQ